MFCSSSSRTETPIKRARIEENDDKNDIINIGDDKNVSDDSSNIKISSQQSTPRTPQFSDIKFNMSIISSARKSISSLPDMDQMSQISRLKHELVIKSNELSRSLIERDQLGSKIKSLIKNHSREVEILKSDQRILYDQCKEDRKEMEQLKDEKSKLERALKSLQNHEKFLQIKISNNEKEESIRESHDQKTLRDSNEELKSQLKDLREYAEKKKIFHDELVSNLNKDCCKYRKLISELENDNYQINLEIQKLKSSESKEMEKSKSFSKNDKKEVSTSPLTPSMADIRRLSLENKQLKENRINTAILQEQIYSLQNRLKIIDSLNDRIAELEIENEQLKRDISQQQSSVNSDLMRENMEKTIELAKLKEEYGNYLLSLDKSVNVNVNENHEINRQTD